MLDHIRDLLTGEKCYDGLVRSTQLDYADRDYTQPVTVDEQLPPQGSTRLGSLIRSPGGGAVTRPARDGDRARVMPVRGRGRSRAQ